MNRNLPNREIIKSLFRATNLTEIKIIFRRKSVAAAVVM